MPVTEKQKQKHRPTKKPPQETDLEQKKTRPERKKHTKVSINGTAVISPQYLSTLFLLVLPLFLPLFVCHKKRKKDKKRPTTLQTLGRTFDAHRMMRKSSEQVKGHPKAEQSNSPFSTVLFSLLLMQSQLLTISSRSGSGGLQGLLELVNFKLDTLLKLLLLLQMLQKC